MTPAKAPAAEEEEQHAEAEEEGDEMYGEDMYARHDPPPVVPADQLPPGTPAPPAALEPEDSDDDDGLNVVMDDSDAGARRTYTRALGRSTRPVGSLSRERAWRCVAGGIPKQKLPSAHPAECVSTPADASIPCRRSREELSSLCSERAGEEMTTGGELGWSWGW